MAFYKVNSGDVPQASDINQYSDGFQGRADFGTLYLADNIGAPSAALTATVVSGSGLSVGAYQYAYSYVTGYKKSNGTLIYTGETTLSPVANVTTTSGNQKVNLSNIATSSAPYVIARRIYRTKVGGSTFYKLAEISDNTTTTYTDTTADTALTITAPSSNTTGTGFSKVNIGTDGTKSVKLYGGHLHIENNGGYVFNDGVWGAYLNGNCYFDGTNWNRYDTTKPASSIICWNDQEPTFRSAGSGANPISWNQYKIFHEGNFSTRTHVEVYMNSAQQSLSTGNWNRIKYDTKVIDYLNEFDTSQNIFTALNTGIYMISAGVRLVGLTVGANVILETNQINRSGNYYMLFEEHCNAATVQYSGTQVLYMNAGTQLEIRVQCSSSASADIGKDGTWLNISRVA